MSSFEHPWTELEDAVLTEFYPRHGGVWEGWAEVMPNRTIRAIMARARRIGLSAPCHRTGRSRKRRKEIDGLPVQVELTPDPYERRVMRDMRDGLTPSQIDRKHKWRPGRTVLILTARWAREKEDRKERPHGRR